MTTQIPNSTVVQCPLDGCGWQHTEPDMNVSPDVLAGMFGTGVMAAVALHQRARRIESELRRHFDSHKPEDYLRTITRLSQVNGELHRAIATMSEACNGRH